MTDQGASILRWIEDRADEMADVLVKLIAVDTENPRGRELRRCAELLHPEMKRLGRASEILPIPPTEGLEDSCILCASVGNGSRVVYSHGHFDVVPAQDRAPFQPSLRTEDQPAGVVLSRCIRLVEGSLPRFEMCAGIVDTRWYAQLRIPALSYGAGHLDVSRGPREFIDEAKMRRCAAVYALFVQEILARGLLAIGGLKAVRLAEFLPLGR